MCLLQAPSSPRYPSHKQRDELLESVEHEGLRKVLVGVRERDPHQVGAIHGGLRVWL